MQATLNFFLNIANMQINMTKFLCVQALSSRTSTILCIRGEGKLEALGFIGFSVSELSKIFLLGLSVLCHT